MTPAFFADVSPDFEETWAFLDRSLRGVAEAGKAVNEISLARLRGGLCGFQLLGVPTHQALRVTQAAATALRGVSRRFDHAPPDATSHPGAAEDNGQAKTKE